MRCPISSCNVATTTSRVTRFVATSAARFEFVAATRWTDATQDQARIAAVKRSAAAAAPFARGAYVNTLGDEGATGVAPAYPPRKLGRLMAIKDVYDPDNVFHLNQNIRPSRLVLRRRGEFC
jgi:hypothetical protein